MEKIREFVTKFRSVYPQFDINKVLEDLEIVVEGFGVKVFYSDMSNFPNPDDVSGYSRVNDKGFPEIVVNGNQPEERRRFTIAHELGHIILHWKWLNKPNQELDKQHAEILFRKNGYTESETLKEKQANEFAAELLAPLHLVAGDIGNLKKRSEYERLFIQRRVANKYKISNQFAGYQINKATRG